MWEVHKSCIDNSVNFTKPFGNGMVECRFVQREADQIIVYLSSHSGCKQACRFCHLTATGQTDEQPVDIDGFRDQLDTVMSYWQGIRSGKEKRLNINWMARGDALNSQVIVNNWEKLSVLLMSDLLWSGLEVKMNISTIFPRSYTGEPLGTFSGPFKPNIYYSLYSLDKTFRKRWLPKAHDPLEVNSWLAEYATAGGGVVVHQAFIDGENDSTETVDDIVEFTKSIPNAKINIVRYNPHNERHGSESSELDRIQTQLSTVVPTQLVPRVGFDVAASCGCFLS